MVKSSNCEENESDCVGLRDFWSFFNKKQDNLTSLYDTSSDFVKYFQSEQHELNFATLYLTGYILQNIPIPNCDSC